MAQAAPEGTTEPVPEAEPYLQGTFKIAKALHDVSLSEASLSWVKKGGASNKKVTVPIKEILSVRKRVGTGAAVLGFDMDHIKHKKKNVMRHEVVHFTGSPGEAEEWCIKIQAAIEKVVTRPHKLLVLVNPVSGNSKGRQIYKKKAAGIFSIASIETDVIVTERAHHTEEILSSYDLTSIDGIILVGGDGLYHEAVNGLQFRQLKEAGLDKNDSSIDLPLISMPIGIIPAGTGNGIAAGCYGTYDIESAVLAIVIGKKQRNNIVGVHCNGKLISYSSLLVGYGLWGDIIYIAESRRYLGKLRYPVCIFEGLIVYAQRHMDLTIDYLPPRVKPKSCDQDSELVTNTDQDNQPIKTFSSDLSKGNQPIGSSDVIGATASDSKWETCQGDFVAAIVFNGDLVTLPSATAETAEDCVTLLCNRPMGKWSMIKFMKKLFTMDVSLFEEESVVAMPIKAYKLQLNSPSDPQSENGKKEHVMNIDGEIYRLKSPEITVRLHPKTVRLFSSGATAVFVKQHLE